MTARECFPLGETVRNVAYSLRNESLCSPYLVSRPRLVSFVNPTYVKLGPGKGFPPIRKSREDLEGPYVQQFLFIYLFLSSGKNGSLPRTSMCEL